VTGGSCDALPELPEPARAIVDSARRAVLATLDRSGRPHLVPVCYAVRRAELVSAIDDKPKATTRLARVANIEREPSATMLVDRWDEDWTRLGWVMLSGRAEIRAEGSADDELARRYPQYRDAPPRGPVIALVPDAIRWWTST
jgi:PPOX class probable F420-dependent enzyme